MPGPIFTQHASGTVDKIIGSAYPVVKYVAQNMSQIKSIYEHLAEVTNVGDNINIITGVHSNIALLNQFLDSLDSISGITENLTALNEIYNNIDAILSAGTDFDAAVLLAQNSANAAASSSSTATTQAGIATTKAGEALASATAADASADEAAAAAQISGGMRYLFDGTGITAADPGAGKIRFNNGTLSSVTQIYISETDAHSRGLAALIQTWDDNSNASQRATLFFRKLNDTSVFAIYQLASSIADNGGYDTLTTVTHVGSNGTFADGDAIVLEVVRNGLSGAIGGVHMTYSTTTADADPGNGIFRLNNTTIASVTEGYFDNLDTNGNSITNWLVSFDDSSSITKGYLYLRGYTNQTAFAVFKVTGTVVDGSGYRKITLQYLNAGGSFSNNTVFGLVFVPSGDAGSGAVSSVNGASGVVVLNTDNISDSGATNKWATAAEKTKLGYIAVTQAVDLDAIEARVNALDAAIILKGTWDASAGTFPGGGTAQAGESWIVSVAGTVGGTAFSINDRIIAIADNASTGTFAANWFKSDYTDQVLSVAGKTGALTLQVADITDMSANGRSLVSAADYAAMKTLLAVSKADVGLSNVDNTSNATERAATATLTNKRITPRVTSIASSATPTVNTDNTDFVNITALAAAITSMTTNLSGTPTIGQVLVYQIKDNGTARAITWGASFTAKGVALPTTTVISKTLAVAFLWNGANWGCVGSAQEA